MSLRSEDHTKILSQLGQYYHFLLLEITIEIHPQVTWTTNISLHASIRICVLQAAGLACLRKSLTCSNHRILFLSSTQGRSYKTDLISTFDLHSCLFHFGKTGSRIGTSMTCTCDMLSSNESQKNCAYLSHVGTKATISQTWSCHSWKQICPLPAWRLVVQNPSTTNRNLYLQSTW